MSDRTKVILRLLALFGITALIGAALYFIVFRKPPQITDTPTPGTGTQTGGGLSGAETGTPSGVTPGAQPGTAGGTGLTPSAVAQGGLTSFTTLTTGFTRTPTATDKGVAYYDPGDGRFYTVDANGNIVRLSDKQFPNAQNVSFAKDATKAVVEFPDGANVVVNLEDDTQVTLPPHWTSFTFTPDGSGIVSKAMGNDPTNRSLVYTSSDGAETRVVATLGENADRVIASPSTNNDVVGFSRTGSAGQLFGQNQIYLIGNDGEALSSIFVNGSNFTPKWSPDGSQILYSVADAGDEYRPSLWLSDKRGDRKDAIRLRLPVKTTADKCAFVDSGTVYCAVPRTAPANSGATPSLFEGGDTLVKISLPAGTTSLAAVPEFPVTMRNVSINPDGSAFYFQDALGRINTIRLK